MSCTGVFDGHGAQGGKAANFAAERIIKACMKDRRLRPGASDNQHLKALTDICEAVSALVLKQHA